MSGFDVTGDGVKHPVLFASQTMVPGEPIFLLVQDDSSDGKTTSCVTTASLDWVRDQLDQVLRDARVSFDYLEAYVLLPEANSLAKCRIGTTAGTKPGDGPRVILTNEYGVLWSCDL